MGFYDRQEGRWKPSKNGRVVKVVDVVNGVASVDADGDGKADDDAALTKLGLTLEERTQLGATYKPGAELWRSPIQHLTPWDCNWPYGPPAGARSPKTDVPNVKGRSDKPDCQSGSIIGCQAQTLGENFGLTGTGAFLNYSSQRQAGYSGPRTLRIPVYEESPPKDALGVVVEVSVAGQHHRLKAAVGQKEPVEFTWDGKDAYGRPLRGRQLVKGRTGYEWKLQFYASPADFESAWNSVSSSGIAFTIARARTTWTQWQEWEAEVGDEAVSSSQFGGMTLSPQHQLNPQSGRVVLGAGGETLGGRVTLTMRTAAGNGSTVGAGAIATPTAVAVLPDGTLLVAQQAGIWKVSKSGSLDVFAGTRSPSNEYWLQGDSGDLGPATAAKFFNIQSLAVGRDGSVFVADEGVYRIRRIAPDGTVSLLAGRGPTVGSVTFFGDGGPAKDAQLCRPTSVAVDTEGVVFVADSCNHRIRRIGLDGVISTFAGSGEDGGLGNSPNEQLGDGKPAVLAKLFFPTSLSLTKDGSLLFADRQHQRVRKVSTNGIISTVAGGYMNFSTSVEVPATSLNFNRPETFLLSATAFPSGGFLIRTTAYLLFVDDAGNTSRLAGDGEKSIEKGGYAGDNGPAAQAAFVASAGLYSSDGLAVAPSGTLYVLDSYNNRVRSIEALWGTTDLGETSVPSPSGDVVWIFSAQGRHLRTVDAVLGTVLLTFNYDATGLLTSVVDIDKQTLSIERDAGGKVTAIVSPYGQRTTVTLDANGYVSALTNPLGETTRLTLSPTGLLTQMEDALGRKHTYEYDAKGRLLKDSDPAGGFKSLTLEELTNNEFQVTVKTAEGKQETYRQGILKGGEAHLRTMADGTVVKREWPNDGSLRFTSPAGTTTQVTETGDARFGVQSPVPASTEVKLPSGLTRTMTQSNAVTYVGDIVSQGLATFTEKWALNGKEYVSKYEAASKTFTTTTPEGRLTKATVDDKGRVNAMTLSGVTPVSFS